jgi:hypothetical protein
MYVRIGLLGLVWFAVSLSVVEAQTLIVPPVWKSESNQIGAGFGSSVASAGDVNGDGYDDILVGAYSYNGALIDSGSAALFLGSPDGPSKLPDWTEEGSQAYANFGESLAGAGDVNGDGYDDVIVGAWQASRASAYLGSAAGLETSPSWTAQSPEFDFGWSVSSAGDVNGDGYDDVVVSALAYSNDQLYEGRLYVYLGSAAGLEEAPASAVEGNQSYSGFGSWVSRAGDVNGDGYDDVIVGAPRWNHGQNDEGRAFVYLGSAAGLVTTPAWSAESNQGGALMGYWVSSAGDVNGDGYDEVIVGLNTFSGGENAEGAAFVYHGSAAGLSASPSWTTESNQAVAIAGGVSSADLDGDGYSDVLVGYYGYDRDQRNEGRVFAFFGSASGLATRPGWSAEGNQRDSYFGYAVSGAGDVDGDGFDDVLVGAYQFDGGQRGEGRAFTYLGASRRRLR